MRRYVEKPDPNHGLQRSEQPIHPLNRDRRWNIGKISSAFLPFFPQHIKRAPGTLVEPGVSIKFNILRSQKRERI